ncbi:Vacuolar membrane-associated protein iml1 [Cladophialophora carrionii]|uniref:Vacuolar membrane-associated protein IML1 n=1 Tax=Cladophialophora carrionii TaxID=86049 RepID=A0A1C1C7W7_9EURO|nr:Vacuolar membrane-associated protein iml1 [Cladophialophora carrionii]
MEQKTAHRRTSSGSTLRASLSAQSAPPPAPSVRASLWIHDDNFSPEDVLINESVVEDLGIREGSLIRIYPAPETSDVRDFQSPDGEQGDSRRNTGPLTDGDGVSGWKDHYLCIAKFAPAEFKAKQANLQVSIKGHIATAFGFRPRSHVRIVPTSFEDCTASHVEFSFRDTYLARSDMWRLVGQELAGRTVYAGQRITYMGTIKLTVKAIHVHHHRVSTAFFAGTTIPIFRSEAARYVLFIQMSSEMWDFDSEGDGEIMFNKVINGFLPDLFKRWTDLEVRHLVSIVLFGRLEYDKVDLARNKDRRLEVAPASGAPNMTARQYQDFYRVVVTDMASAQWTTILDELKKDFRVFLRDISLHTSNHDDIIDDDTKARPVRIAGRPSTAMKGNILEAINIASTQFAHDFEDRDLIRTGVSIVVVTAGTGVFEVNRDLLNLTSQNLTNNGVGIDIVCLSRMPLHSVPLFKYRSLGAEEPLLSSLTEDAGSQDRHYSSSTSFFDSVQPRKLSPAVSSTATNSTRFFASFMSGRSNDGLHGWSYGIPQWIDLSYWSADIEPLEVKVVEGPSKTTGPASGRKKGPFVPRVRMYEIQMMGLMELGMADMSIPYMTETQGAAAGRVKRRTSKRQHTSGSRSLSHSPTLSRKSRLSAGPRRPAPGLLSSHAKAFGSVFDRMDEYDSALFQTQFNSEAASKAPKAQSRASAVIGTASPNSSEKSQPETKAPKSGSGLTKVLTNKSLNSPFRPQLPSLVSADASSPNMTIKKTPEAAKVNRTLNYALRGLAPPMRAVASTEVNITNAQAQPPFGNPGHSRPTVATTAASIRSVSTNSVLAEKNNASPAASQRSPRFQGRLDNAPSKPISINTPLRKVRDDGLGESQGSDSTARRLNDHISVAQADTGSKHESDSDSSVSTESDISDSSDGVDTADSQLGLSVASSVPKSALPFVRNVNASNPLKRHPERETLYGRWQHLYPRKPRAATVKWRSLCTPASVPLTTEDFPTRDELEMDFDSATYELTLTHSNELLEEPESRDILLREMLALRFAHGYQLVVGPALLEAVGPGTCDSSSFFTPNLVRPDGSFIVMSMGNTIQKISLQQNDRLQVTKYLRRPPAVKPSAPQHISYYPNIRTILSGAYKLRDMQFSGFSEQYPWEAADKYLENRQRQPDVDVQALRFWRARFVLIPVAPPANSWRPASSEPEESEEEIHLRGIRALTQMWQRARYVPMDERRPAHNRLSTVKRKDRNPLRINLETLNPSELVATELDKLVAAEEAGESQNTQLLPEAEQFDRDSFALPKLAQALQGENGIEIKTRRWHWRLHYSCFMGEDLTNWLVHNFRDIDTREEAVELGNELMKENLFEHVNSKHNFKDGNYFYSIKPEYRTQRADARQSWFPASRRSERSIPPTPAIEQPNREWLGGRSRSGSNLAVHGQAASELAKTLADKKKRTVTLSKMIRIDVDTRKRSNKPEIVNLHYDRIHNPENCYHLELSWLNTTSKLVDDAIVGWTTQAEKYGLKLVEVPIAEAFKVPEHEPFRAAYRVKLALDPPRRSAATSMYFTAVAFGPQTPLKEDVHFYQKALLKRFNFVLDLEAPSEFPENVEIKYSWGDLDYRYTQFVHRSGVCLAQITDEGDFLLLANRLYNSRQASAKETSKFDTSKKDNLTPNTSSSMLMRPQTLTSTHSAPPPSMQASGIIGLNVQSPRTGPYASPLIRPLKSTPMPPTMLDSRASSSLDTGIGTGNGTNPSSTPSLIGPTMNNNKNNHQYQPVPYTNVTIPQTPKITADVLGTRRALIASGLTHYVTPEQIKDDIESFCQDVAQLDDFYKEVTATLLPALQASLRDGTAAVAAAASSSSPQMGASMSSITTTNVNGNGNGKEARVRTGKTSSSLLRPLREPVTVSEGIGMGMGVETIPEFKLPGPKYGPVRKQQAETGGTGGSGGGVSAEQGAIDGG